MRYLIHTLFFLIYFSLQAQVTDTLFLKDDLYAYSVTHRSASGKLIAPVAYFDSSDVLLKSVTERNGVGNLDVIYYYNNGTVRLSMSYRKGVFHGRMTSYYSNGGIEWIKRYKNGKLHGERVAYTPTGTLFDGVNEFVVPYSDIVITTTCIKGRPDGKLVAAYPDGRVSFTGQFYVGFANGEFRYYDDDGKLIRTDIYHNGKFKGEKKQ